MIFEKLNDNITTIALVIVGLALLLRFFSRSHEEEDNIEERPVRRKSRRVEDDEIYYDMEKDHFREDERYDFVDDEDEF